MQKSAYSNYQERATEFSVGDEVFPLIGSRYLSGRVVAVWPAIGMIDVEFPNGNKRFPVEDVQLLKKTDSDVQPAALEHANAPGGEGTVPVTASRIAKAFLKKSLYWTARDRKYRATRSELNSGSFSCPKCSEASLKKTIYKRAEGSSVRLYGCPSCLFLIKECDILEASPCSEQDDILEEEV